MKLLILKHENITYKFINCDKGERNMKKLLHAHEFCLTIISHASFSEREGDLGLTWNVHARHGEERGRKVISRHASQPRIRIVMPGMKIDEMSFKKRTKE